MFLQKITQTLMIYIFINESFKYYGDHSLMGNITGNHDIPRFIFMQAMVFLLMKMKKKQGGQEK